MREKSIARHCPQCKQFSEIDAHLGNYSCVHCANHWGKISDLNNIFDRCPFCECRQFYITKNFNQFIGCSIMLIGIVLVPWSFGLSLPVMALIDWLLYRKVPNVIVCYKCGTEFHGFPPKKTFKPFMHHIGLKYDKYR